MWALLLISVACAQDTDVPMDFVGPVEEDVLAEEGDPPQDRVGDPTEDTNSDSEEDVAEEARDASLQASGLAFYLEDKKALTDGEISEEWELPPLSLYKEEPWCHAPEPHGKHIPQDVDHPALQKKESPPLELNLLDLGSLHRSN